MSNQLVSIIIRTCNRPSLLKEALLSVQKQTYKNLEVIIIEDGKPTAKEVISEFDDLEINYRYTDSRVGRTKAANLGMSISRGEYLNFLDDDDLLLPSHVETMVEGFAEFPDADAVHARSLERKIKYTSMEPLRYYVASEVIKYNRPLEKDELLFQNRFPIQAVMIKRELYEKFGGMDEELDLLEDWDLWIKYSLQGRFYYIDKTTSVYHVPGDNKKSKQRDEELRLNENYLKEKYKEYIAKSDFKKPRFTIKLFYFMKANGILRTLKEVLGKLLKK